jgi:hypothetical protein
VLSGFVLKSYINIDNWFIHKIDHGGLRGDTPPKSKQKMPNKI